MEKQENKISTGIHYKYPTPINDLKELYGKERMQQYLSANNFPHNKTIIYKISKRIFDFIGASIALIILLPVFILIYLVIKITSHGPAIICQERVGKDGKIFTMYKFRTMHHHVSLYDHAPVSGEDMRINNFGRFLRKSSLDELPQFINVIRGDMAIVGPRPEMPFLVNSYKPWQKVRIIVKPGITGLWQINGRKDRPLLENIEYDLFYIERQSLKFDIIICLYTLPSLIMAKGAY